MRKKKTAIAITSQPCSMLGIEQVLAAIADVAALPAGKAAEILAKQNDKLIMVANHQVLEHLKKASDLSLNEKERDEAAKRANRFGYILDVLNRERVTIQQEFREQEPAELEAEVQVIKPSELSNPEWENKYAPARDQYLLQTGQRHGSDSARPAQPLLEAGKPGSGSRP